MHTSKDTNDGMNDIVIVIVQQQKKKDFI